MSLSPMGHNNSIQNTKKKKKNPLQSLFLMSHIPVQYIRLSTESITEQADKPCFVSLQKGSEETL